MKKKISITSIFIGDSLIIMYVTAIEQKQNNESKKHNLTIIHDDKLVYNENVEENTEISNKINNSNTTLENIKMTDSKKITLEPFDLPNSKIISYWKKEVEEDQEVISPVLVEKKDFIVTYHAGQGSMIKDQNE